QVGPHTTGREVPDPFGIFASIGMRVEVTRPVITYFFQELDQQERCLNILRPEAEVLIESTWFLVVQVDVKQLTGFPGLSNTVVDVQPGHLFVGELRVDSHHLRKVQGFNKRQHMSGGRKINVSSRLIRLGFQCEVEVVAIVLYITTEEVDAFAVPLEGFRDSFRYVDLSPFSSAPEDIGVSP